MCGIGGFTILPPGLIKSEWLEAFLQDLAHRGPDDSGWVSLNRGKCRQGKGVEQDIAGESLLVHRRLSILDLSEAGHQPMCSADGRYWITFNGEIYNYVELREELKGLGHKFRTQSDTEVLLAAYVQWSAQCLNRLIGMFAFAILDIKARRLWLARDVFGVKPLYYTNWQEGFSFASEIPPLLKLPGVSREVNPQRLYAYLCSGLTDSGAETLFAQIKQLPAAHYMEVSLDDPHISRPVRYWDIDLTGRVELSFDEAAAHLRELFLESVRLHLRSDVPVGAALSGGIDSSSIVMAMRYLDDQLDIHAFSYVAQDPTISEERWIDVVGAAGKLVVHKVRPHPEELAIDLDHLIGLQGEPFISTSMYAQYRVFRHASQAGIKVMLDGQGADELLAGYPNYRLARICSLMRQGSWHEALQLSCARSSPRAALQSIARAIARLAPASIQFSLRRLQRQNTVPSWLNVTWLREHGVEQETPYHLSCEHFLRQELHRSLSETSLPQLLHYEDRNSMGFSIESRVPFLTPAIAGFLLSLPEEYVLSSNGTSKAVFRHAMRGIVPDSILARQDKLGFPTPERQWLVSLGNWVEQVLANGQALQINALHFQEIRRQWQEIRSGTRPFDSRVWRWVNTILWVQKFSVEVP